MITESDVTTLFSTKNCCQILLGHYAERTGMSESACQKVGRPFAGGVMMRGKTCGFALAAYIILGFLVDGDDEFNQAVEAFDHDFNKDDSNDCADLTRGLASSEKVIASCSTLAVKAIAVLDNVLDRFGERINLR